MEGLRYKRQTLSINPIQIGLAISRSVGRKKAGTVVRPGFIYRFKR